MKATDPESDVKTEQQPRQMHDRYPTSQDSGTDVIYENRQYDAISPSPSYAESVQAESTAQEFSALSFVSLLIPRFSDHFLIGDVTDALEEWMKQICISYSWRLDAIAVRPGYLQWVMRVPLNANPSQFMRIVRQHTSRKIFDDFPRFKRQNMSGQFWAPGNFVVGGNQLQTLETINTFILQTRRSQGIF